uniref:Uncharacterized protein n=1 Tax=Anopheles quadriannulatus TaxID=34691 RepID=A0A182XSA1_ANOQN
MFIPIFLPHPMYQTLARWMIVPFLPSCHFSFVRHYNQLSIAYIVVRTHFRSCVLRSQIVFPYWFYERETRAQIDASCRLQT